MKKVLLISALVMTIVASMVSGTLAVYTRTIGPYSKDVMAKNFVLVSPGTLSFTDDVLIAPTETPTMVFTVANFDATATSEVNMNLVITVNFTALSGGAILPMTATITGSDSGVYSEVSSSYSNGVGVFTIHDAFTSTAARTLTYTINLGWPSTANDYLYAGHTKGSNVAVTVTGTQS